MTEYKYALADPEYVLEITGFYWDTVVDGGVSDKVRRVYELAKISNKPQLDIARGVAQLVASDPPRFTSFDSVKKYFVDRVLSNIPRRYVYDDVFWCCFLAEADDSGIPECSLGGPLHKMVIKVHDDFEPEDVVL